MAFVGILFVAWLFSPGCGPGMETSDNGNPQELRIGTPMRVRQANLLADYSYSIFAMLTTHETLVRFNSAMEPVPQLAMSWESSPDATQWKFHLVENAVWHDGKPVTAEDVKFTFEYMAANHSASAWIRDLICDIQVADRTVTFFLNRPYSRFLINVGFIIRILPKHVWQQVENPLQPGIADISIGCGPYFLERFDTRENRIRFHKNKDYYGPEPTMETLEFLTNITFDNLTLSLIRGDVDMFYKYASGFLTPYLFRIAQSNSVRIIYADGLGIPAALGFNLKQGPTADQLFRKALVRAFDYKRITQSLLGDSGKIPSVGFIPPALKSFLVQPSLSFSPDQSRAMLSAAGYIDTDNDGLVNHPVSGENVSLKLLTRSDLAGMDALLPILLYNLRQIGISLVVEKADLSTWIARVREKKHDLVLFRTTPWGMVMEAGCGTGYFDSRRSGGGTLANVEDSVFHGLCDRILATTDPLVEEMLYQKVQQYYASQLPAVALCWTVNAYPYATRLHDLVINPIEGGLVNRETLSLVEKFSGE